MEYTSKSIMHLFFLFFRNSFYYFPVLFSIGYQHKFKEQNKRSLER